MLSPSLGRWELLGTTPELPLLFGNWGEAVPTVTEGESPSSKGWGVFYPSQGISSAGELNISTYTGAVPAAISSGVQLVQSSPCPPASSQPLAAVPKAAASVLCGARRVGRLHPCASFIGSWHRAGDVLMDGRQLPASDGSPGSRAVTGHGARNEWGGAWDSPMRVSGAWLRWNPGNGAAQVGSPPAR